MHLGIVRVCDKQVFFFDNNGILHCFNFLDPYLSIWFLFSVYKFFYRKKFNNIFSFQKFRMHPRIKSKWRPRKRKEKKMSAGKWSSLSAACSRWERFSIKNRAQNKISNRGSTTCVEILTQVPEKAQILALFLKKPRSSFRTLTQVFYTVSWAQTGKPVVTPKFELSIRSYFFSRMKSSRNWTFQRI